MPALKTLDGVHQWTPIDCSIGGNVRAGREIAPAPVQFNQLRDSRIRIARRDRFLHGGKPNPMIFVHNSK